MILPYASLADLNLAVAERQIITFQTKGQIYTVEPHMVAQYKKTGAFVLVAWKLSPTEGWERFRFCEIRGLEAGSDRFIEVREGFDPADRYFSQVIASVSKRTWPAHRPLSRHRSSDVSVHQ